jgi:TIR domain
MPSPFVFLSHSGADAEAARELKRRLESAPDARQASLKVWFDKDDLRPGTPWSAQIAEAIQTHATAFVVYVGSGGVMNWVEAEVDLAI